MGVHSPFSSVGSIVIRKSAASTIADVIWQTMTDAWLRESVALQDDSRPRFSVIPGSGDRTTSPRRIGIEVGYRLDPIERLALAFLAELGNLRRDPAPDGCQASIGDHKPQLAQTPRSSALAHHPHPLGCDRHRTLPSTARRRNALHCGAQWRA
jgi:hypothetical protein